MRRVRGRLSNVDAANIYERRGGKKMKKDRARSVMSRYIIEELVQSSAGTLAP